MAEKKVTLHIDANMTQEKNKNTLKRAIQKLPTYQAPPHIWSAIENNLTTNSSQKVPFWNTWRRIAASIVVLIGLGLAYFWFGIRSTEEKPYRIEAEQSLEKNIELDPVQEVYVDDSIHKIDSIP